MMITRADLEASLAALAQGVRDPIFGIHGPDSLAWRWNGETINFLGAGRAVLLQLSHPYVAYAIEQHSVTRDDVRGRFVRTFDNMFAMSFGSFEDACAAARQVYRVHTRIHGALGEDAGRHRAGDRYRANDAASLLWVHATLLDTVLAVRKCVGLSAEAVDRERFYQDSKRFARLFGLEGELVPVDVAAHDVYMRRMVESGELAVTRPAREMARFILAPPTRALAPVFRWYRIVTAGLLPAPLREGFGLPWGPGEARIFEASTRALGPLARLTPRSLRHLSGYQRAQSRVTGAPDSPVTRLASRVAEAGLSLWR